MEKVRKIMHAKDWRHYPDGPSIGQDFTVQGYQAVRYYCYINTKGSSKVQAVKKIKSTKATLLKSSLIRLCMLSWTHTSEGNKNES